MVTTESQVAVLESQLNDFDLAVRSEALSHLSGLAAAGKVALEPGREVANLHAHTFFSFNAYGHSPSSLAWLARRRGYRLMGMVDFDVLDGVDEFLSACDAVGVRGTAGVETRLYIPEFGTREINSPGEPGVYYHVSVGFTSSQCPPEVAGTLDGMRQRANRRNREMIDRINAHLAPVHIDYDRDVLPLTPAGNATERHILVAYLAAAAAQARDLAGFWSDRLGVPREQVEATLPDGPKFQNLVRTKLMKRGGVGYVQPGPESFPTVEEFHRFTVACGALPAGAWLDGTSVGEQAYDELAGLLLGKGNAALTIIPDRNWNIADPEVRKMKVSKLYQVVDLARQLALPIGVGTEMNSYGQKLVDDFDVPELAPLAPTFMDGAYFMYGHTVLQRWLGLGYQSPWAQSYLADRPARNDFYTRIGRLVPPGPRGRAMLESLGSQRSPTEMLARLQ